MCAAPSHHFSDLQYLRPPFVFSRREPMTQAYSSLPSHSRPDLAGQSYADRNAASYRFAAGDPACTLALNLDVASETAGGRSFDAQRGEAAGCRGPAPEELLVGLHPDRKAWRQAQFAAAECYQLVDELRLQARETAHVVCVAVHHEEELVT